MLRKGKLFNAIMILLLTGSVYSSKALQYSVVKTWWWWWSTEGLIATDDGGQQKVLLLLMMVGSWVLITTVSVYLPVLPGANLLQ